MKLCFVLDRPELGGGVKVVFQLAAMAQALGHQVEVHGIGPMPGWAREYFAGRYLDRELEPAGTGFDLAMGTYYTTLDYAEQLGAGQVVHFCQGYEGDFEHLAAAKAQIEAVYARPHRLLTVNPDLGRRLARQFGKAWRFVPPPADGLFHPAADKPPRPVPRIAIPGNFEVLWKGVRTCLDAVVELRRRGVACEVVRYSLLPRSELECSILADSQFVYAASPAELSADLRSCDLLLQGSTRAEGFGLPAMEAALSGVPVVCTDLAAMRMLGIPRENRVPPGDSRRMADAAGRLLANRAAWRRAGELAGQRVRSRFGPGAVSVRLAAALLWAAGEA